MGRLSHYTVESCFSSTLHAVIGIHLSWESKLRLWRPVMAPPSLSLDRESPVTMCSLSRTARKLTAAGIVDSHLSSLLERKRLLLDGMKVWPRCPVDSGRS